VQESPTIRGEKSYARGEISKIQRATQDDIAFEEIAALSIPPTADDPSLHDALLDKVRPFMKNYAYSKHMPAARQLASTLEAERARLAAGEVKIDGLWVGADAMVSDKTEIGGRLQLSKMKNTADPVAVLSAFETLQKSYGNSSSYPEGVALARVALGQMRGSLTRASADLERKNREQQQGLQLASVDRRALMEKGIEQEKAATQAQIDRTKQSGKKWFPILLDTKALDELSKLVDSDEERLSKIDAQSMASAVTAAGEAKQQIADGRLAEAKLSIERARTLWPKYVLLASLQESLKKAQLEAAKKPGEENKP